MASALRQRQTRLPSKAPSVSSVSRTLQQHVSLSRRLLFHHLPPNASLPALLASESIPPELTSELYDLIALALRAYVNPWWSKITRYDKEFLPEITRILTVFVRALESRALAADLSPLVFRDIPTLITQHYRDYRNALSKLDTSYASGGAASLPQLLHQLQPHMAIGADGKIDEEYFRQIIDHILKRCLPPEDYQPDAERFIIREVALNIFLQDIVPKISQPWFIYQMILDDLGFDHQTQNHEPPDPSSSISTNDARSHPYSTSFSFHNFLIVFLSAIQSISSACLALIHTYKQAVSTIKLVNKSPTIAPNAHPSHPYPSPSPSPPPGTLSAPQPPNRISPSPSLSSSVSSGSIPPHQPHQASYSASPPANDFSHAPLVMFSEIFTTSERFASNVITNSVSMLAASTTPFLDRLLPHLLATALSPQFFAQMTRMCKRTLFPNGYPTPPPPHPTPEEQAAMKEKLIKWRPRGGALAYLIPFLLGPSPDSTLATALEPLSSAPCNVHLIVFILDRILIALFPELGGHQAGFHTLSTLE